MPNVFITLFNPDKTVVSSREPGFGKSSNGDLNPQLVLSYLLKLSEDSAAMKPVYEALLKIMDNQISVNFEVIKESNEMNDLLVKEMERIEKMVSQETKNDMSLPELQRPTSE